MSTRAALASLLSLTLSITALAQSEFMPEAGNIGLTINTRLGSSVDSKLKQGNSTYKEVLTGSVEIGAAQTFRFSQNRILRIGLEHQVTSIDQNLEQGDAVVPLPEELSSLSASASYTHIASRQWIFTGRVGLGSHVTNEGLLSEGWAGNAMAMAIYNRSQALTYIFGLAYTSNLEDLRLLPFFGLNWRPAPKWSVAVGFPKTGVTYHINKNLSLGLGFSGAGGAYYVKKDPLPGVAPRPLSDCWLQQRDIRLGFEANWKINQTVRLSGSVGQVLYRKFKYVDRDFELKSDNFAPFFSVAGVFSF